MDELELLKKAVEIPSISGWEDSISQFLLNQMKEMGFDVKKDKVGNVIGQIGTGKPVLLLSSHMDTVPGHSPVKIENGKLYGRGAVDAKGSLLAMICATARFSGKKLPGKIIVAGIVEEETTLKGIDALLESLEPIDYAIFGEPSGVNRICVASKGRIHLHVTFKTSTGYSHVSALGHNENAIHLAIEFWNQLVESMSQRPFQGKTPYFSVEPNITVIQGGEATNVLPTTCEMDIDLRFPPGLKSSQIVKAVNDIVENRNIDMEILSQIEGFRADKETTLAKALKSAIEDVTKAEAKFLRKSGTNFMAIIAEKLQIPVISYGPGDSTLDHTPTEHIEIAEYQKAIDVIEKFISYILPK